MAIQDRGYSNHYVETDINVPPGGTLDIEHGMGHEPDYALLKVKSSVTSEPTATALDRDTVQIENTDLANPLTLDALFAYWHSVVK